MGDLTNVPPFGMSPALPAFHRATRIAEALFGGAEASVVLVDGDARLAQRRQPGRHRDAGDRRAYVMKLERSARRPGRRAEPERRGPSALCPGSGPARRCGWRTASTIGVLTVMARRRAPMTRRWPHGCRIWPTASPTSASAPAPPRPPPSATASWSARKVMAAFVASVADRVGDDRQGPAGADGHAALAGRVRHDRGAGGRPRCCRRFRRGLRRLRGSLPALPGRRDWCGATGCR